MKKYLLLLFILISAKVYSQENASMYGNVKDSVGNNLAGATILFKAIHCGAISDFEGNYKLINIPSGKYVVEVGYLGLPRIYIKNVLIKNNTIYKRDFRLIEKTGELPSSKSGPPVQDEFQK